MSLTRPKRAPEERTGNEVRPEPPCNVILHNSWHTMTYVVYILEKSIPGLNWKKTTKIMLTAHKEGQSVAKSCHKELAELYEERLKAGKLTASIEPAD